MSETSTRSARLRRKTRRERPAAKQAALSSTGRPDDNGGDRRSSAGSPALTWRQAGIYRDGVTFFSHILAHNPQARDAHLNLVGPLSDAGRLEDALAAARVAVEQLPDHPMARKLVEELRGNAAQPAR